MSEVRTYFVIKYIINWTRTIFASELLIRRDCIKNTARKQGKRHGFIENAQVQKAETSERRSSSNRRQDVRFNKRNIRPI